MTKQFWKEFGDLEFMAKRKDHKSYLRVSDLITRFGPPSGSVLDVGVLSGVLYPMLRDRNSALEYTGLDISPNVIENNKSRYGEASWVCADIEDLPFPDQSFDIVVVRHVLEHLETYKEGLSEVARVSKYLIVVCFFSPLGEVEVIRQKPDSVYVNTYSRDDFVANIPSTWQIVHEELVQDPHRDNHILVMKRAS